MLIMPMTTSVVALHRSGQRKRLIALLAVGLLSAGASGVLLGLRHRTYPSLETRYRVGHRSLVNKQQAEHVMTAALQVAWKKRREGAWGREDDGLLSGPALEAARKALERFYRGDEASAFELWTSARIDRVQIIVLYAEGPKRGGPGKPVFLAMKSDGTLIRRMADVPREARRMMRTVDDLGRWDEL
jgi:hypothetical protein